MFTTNIVRKLNNVSSIEIWWNRSIFAWYNDGMSFINIEIRYGPSLLFAFNPRHMYNQLPPIKREQLLHMWGIMQADSQRGKMPQVRIELFETLDQ